MIQSEYFDWLLFQVDDHEHPELIRISTLLHELSNYEFRVTIHGDLPRLSDAEVLRERYLSECQPSVVEVGPISMLEVMVSLAIRCENDIMWDPTKPYKPCRWIWVMVNSLGLSDYQNDIWNEAAIARAVSVTMDHFYRREYAYNGRGSLFSVSRPVVDFRSIGIWSQMNHYLAENLGL